MALTEAGLALGPLIRQLGEWGLQSAHDPLEEGDLDVTVLTWNMRRRVDPTVFPERRITVYFEFTDVPKNKAQWWVVNDRESVDLCPKDPGFPVDLYVTTDIRTMIDIWLGKRAWDAAVGSGHVEVTGPRELRDRIKSWLLLSPIRVKSALVPDQDRMVAVPAQPTAGTESVAVARQPVNRWIRSPASR